MGQAFFDVGCVALAKKLIGRNVVCRFDASGTRLVGKIVETEAYPGGDDEASHGYQGKRTPRNEALYMSPGTAYVYIIYGMYHNLNVSAKESGGGVLIRALEPLEGIEAMAKNRGMTPITLTDVAKRKKGAYKIFYNLTSGPAKLCQSLGITTINSDKLALYSDQSPLFIEITGDAIDSKRVICDHRIGIDRVSAKWRLQLWRFYLSGNPHVSKIERDDFSGTRTYTRSNIRARPNRAT